MKHVSVSPYPADLSSDIAIIGMHCRIPGARNTDEFWNNLRDGVESIVHFDDAELRNTGISEFLLNSKNYVKAGVRLDDIDLFDAAFFGLTPREAQLMDPQVRLFLEASWELFELAGHIPGSPDGLVGVFAGMGSNDYFYDLISSARVEERIDEHKMRIANERAALANTISYRLNLRGPSITIQTACSTSLVAVHVACQALLDGECDIALAGGVSINTSELKGYLYEEGNILSPDGHCRPFDARSRGTVPGGGLCMVLLRPLETAFLEGDFIHAVIKGSAVTNDGALKVGYTAPSIDGQRRAIASALKMAELEPEDISYIEAHGTGTMLGDPIEVSALTQAFREGTIKNGFCALGSVKSNIGHADTAAGAAGLIKTALALKHRQIPPSLHYESANANIDFAKTPFYVNTKLCDWVAPAPLRAGVSSCGIGGTNSHVILEEPPERDRDRFEDDHAAHLLILSAKDALALEQSRQRLAQYLKNNSNVCLADVEYTLQVGRKDFLHRRAVVSSGRDRLISALEIEGLEHSIAEIAPEDGRGVVFLFPPGDRYLKDVTRVLYDEHHTFRSVVDNLCEYLRPVVNWDLRDVICGALIDSRTPAYDLKEKALEEPTRFIVEYALAQLWIGLGIRPRSMLGYGVGEYVAACIAEVMTVEEALDLTIARTRAMQALPAASTLAVDLSEEELLNVLPQDLSLVAVESMKKCVISGSSAAVDQFERQLRTEQIPCEHITLPYQCGVAATEPIMERFGQAVGNINLKEPRCLYASSVTGKWITGEETTNVMYWRQQLSATLRFGPSMEMLIGDSGDDVLLELGSGRLLSDLAREAKSSRGIIRIVPSLNTGDRAPAAYHYLLTSLAEMWVAGVQVDWKQVHVGRSRYRVPLPTYPFERHRYWFDASTKPLRLPREQPTLNGKTDLSDWFYIPSWKRTVPVTPAKTDWGSRWLVFQDSCGLGSMIAAELLGEGQEVFSVDSGAHFEKNTSTRFTVNPGTAADYNSLVKELRDYGGIPQNIIHLWSVTAYDACLEALSLERVLDGSFHSLLYLAAALGSQVSSARISLHVLSNDLQDVVGERVMLPARATLFGPCKAIPREYPNVRCRVTDVRIPTDPFGRKQLVKSLIAEFKHTASDEVVAYRGGHRWTPSFEPYRMSAPMNEYPRIRPGGVYLITGGLGGLGLVFAEYLARGGAAALILISRSGLRERQQWQGQESDLNEKPDSRAISKLKTIEALGAQVVVFSGDVSDKERMRHLVEKTTERFGVIHGVIHAAGVAGGGITGLRSMEDITNVLRPKVTGTLILEELLHEMRLDFFVLCSSLTGIVGAAGQADYVAANSFLDAFAHSRKRSIAPVSINWCGWTEVGMLADSRSGRTIPPQFLNDNFSNEICSTEGIEILGRILSAPMPQVAVSKIDLNEVILSSQAVPFQPVAVEHHFASRAPSASKRPRNEIEDAVCAIWEEQLGLGSIARDDDFTELGGDSLLAIQIAARVRQLFEVDFSVAAFYEKPTIAGITEQLVDTLMRNEPDQELVDLIAQINVDPDRNSAE